ncbi:MAG: hypothetical protein QXS57_00925 [Candidatus Caldarchaeum sp.]
MKGLAEDEYVVEAFLSKFPFLKEIREYVASLNLRLEDFADARVLVETAVKRVEEALSKGPGRMLIADLPSDVEILSHPLAMALVAMLDSVVAKRRFAAHEAERYAHMIKNVREGQKQVIHYVMSKVLGMNVRLGNHPHEFWVHFPDYLKLSVNLNEPRFKLVNRLVEKGYVGVSRPEAITLSKNGLEMLIYERLNKVGRVEPPEFLKEHVSRLTKTLESFTFSDKVPSVRLGPENWPPCMNVLRTRLQAGEPISHFANFTLAAFMLKIGVGVEEVVAVYSQRGDFDPRIARYQVEHIAGLKGSRTKYSVPRCATIQAHGLCIEEGRLCGGVKSPMQFYRRKARAVGGLRKVEDSQPASDGS